MILAFDRRAAEYLVIELAAPGAPPRAIGVFLFQPAAGRLDFKLRDAIAALAEDLEPEEFDALEGLGAQIERDTRDEGPEAYLRRIEDGLSNIIRIGERRPAGARDLEALFREHVVRPRIPVYSLRAAAGKFGEDMEAEAEGSVEAPPGLRLTPDLFAVHVVGHSMEPVVPDGSLALFRTVSAGTRQGKRVLVRRPGAFGGEFTLKVYRSRKRYFEDGSWEHAGINLVPANPDYEQLDLDATGEYQVIGEFIQVL